MKVESENDFESSEDGGFKFAITLIVACISVIIYIQNYAENNLVSSSSTYYAVFSMFIFLSIILFLYIIFYIFFKAVSLETKGHDNKKRLQDIAKEYYVDAFRVASLLIMSAIFVGIWNIPFYIGVIILCLVTLLASLYSSYMYLSKHEIFKQMKRKLSNYIEMKLPKLVSKAFLLCILFILIIMIFYLFKINFLFGLFLICIIILYIFISRLETFKPLNLLGEFKNYGYFILLGVIITILTLPFMLSGHLIADVDSIYYKQDEQIPVDISLTGLHISEGVVVKLYHIGSEEPIDSINISSSSNISEKFLGKYRNTYLCGNNLGLGKYKVFINCTSLTEGIYVLSITTGNNSNELLGKPSTLTGYLLGVLQYLSGVKTVNNSFYLTEANRTYAP
jgi:hypothetical protein